MQKFFEKTIIACGSKESGLDSALFKQLQQGGIMANFADLSADERGIYFRFSSNNICKIMLYQARVQEVMFRSKGDPFCAFVRVQGGFGESQKSRFHCYDFS